MSAKASVASAEALVRQTSVAFERQKELLIRGNTTRRDHDQAEADMRAAEAQLKQAQSDLKLAEDQLSYTELRADADGIITSAKRRGRPGGGPGPADLHPGARRRTRCRVQRP